MFEKILIFLSCLIGFCGTPSVEPEKTDGQVKMPFSEYIRNLKSKDVQLSDDGGLIFLQRSTLSGDFLASRFAQKHQDWEQASVYLDKVLKRSPEKEELLSRAMVLAMGAGHHEKAIRIAHQLVDLSEEDALGPLPFIFLAMEAFKTKSYDQAREYINNVPQGTISDFIIPLLKNWTRVSDKNNPTYEIQDLLSNTIHIYHAFLMGDYISDRAEFRELLKLSLNADGLAVQDLERIADVYTLIGDPQAARKLYQKTLESWPGNRRLLKKLETIKADENVVFFESVLSPEKGVALALFDMAHLLFNENSDDSARVFAQIALYLDPSLAQAHLLLGYINARHKHYPQAVAHYAQIPENHDRYLEARKLSATLFEDMGKIEQAVHALENIANEFDDVDSLIQIGNVYRRNEEFQKAVKSYNAAAKALDNKITTEHWQLHYMRGVAYERMGKWDKAEKDLQAALSLRPNHPLVLNYLGYAWADQGKNLDQALDMIRKAAALEPEDGYITDSLGWVLYRMGQFEEAIPHLENAVELLPYDPIINDHLGGAYWRVNRKLEARFQWNRAKNYSKNEDDKMKIK